MPPPTLITGATGFIGRQLTSDLVKRGQWVRILARSPRKARNLFGDGVEIAHGDLTDAPALAEACRGVEVVYHIAGTYRFGLRQRRELWRTNVEGTENVLRAAWTAGVAKVVHLSSGGVLQRPARQKARLIDERDFADQPARLCPYKASKWHAEKRVLNWAARGLPVVIAATTCPIGPGDEGPTPTGRIIRDFLQRKFPFYCRTGLNFLGVADLSRGLQATAARGATGQRYLLSGANLWLKDFLQLLASDTGFPAPRVCLPGPLVSFIGIGGEAWDLFRPTNAGARVCIETALQSHHTQFFSNAKARAELDWAPLHSTSESIADAVDWFRTQAEPEPLSAAASMETHVR